ncbi:MAG: alpha/beta hydrolase [Bacteroidales bacterium]|nr:alpha/beta hydrolase [Bacteroidales bacterium]
MNPITLIIIVLALIVMLFVATFIMYKTYFHNPLGQDEDKFLDTVTNIQYPGTKEWVKDNIANGTFTDVFIDSKIEHGQHAYVASHNGATRTVILVHGYSGCAFQMMPYARPWFEQMGYNIVVIDLPNHGRSEGNVTHMGWKERLILIEWIKKSQELFPDTSIYLHGLSMGAATILMAAGDGLPTYVKGIVSDCSFSSVWDEIKHVSKDKHIPIFPFLYLSNIIAKLYFGWSYTEASVIKQTAKISIPVLFIHGDADLRVPVDQAYNLFKAKATGKKELWITKDAGHACSLILYQDRYIRNIKAFFEE